MSGLGDLVRHSLILPHLGGIFFGDPSSRSASIEAHEGDSVEMIFIEHGIVLRLLDQQTELLRLTDEGCQIIIDGEMRTLHVDSDGVLRAT
jgi:hypothetical protein